MLFSCLYGLCTDSAPRGAALWSRKSGSVNAFLTRPATRPDPLKVQFASCECSNPKAVMVGVGPPAQAQGCGQVPLKVAATRQGSKKLAQNIRALGPQVAPCPDKASRNLYSAAVDAIAQRQKPLNRLIGREASANPSLDESFSYLAVRNGF